jgi:hypothetical protein
MAIARIGPAGFEPATCRRGDRTTGAARPARLGRALF